jgi:hypothetical protein
MMTYTAHREAQEARNARMAEGRTSMSSVGTGGDDYAARLILSATLADGGGTFTADGKRANLRSGYMVGLGTGVGLPAAVLPLSAARTPAAVATVRAVMDAGSVAGYHVGTWVHDGMIYVERAAMFADLRLALRVAADRGERSIWDNANGREIPASDGR